MTTIKTIIINQYEAYQLPRPLEVEEPVDRRKVMKALIEAWTKDYEKLNKEIKEKK